MSSHRTCYVRSNVAAMKGYAPGEQPQGGKFIKLNTNENPYPPSGEVFKTLAAVTPQQLMKYPDAMANSFRICAAQLLDVEPDWILCGNGSDDILTIVTRALVGQGEWIRTPSPSYVLYQTLAEIQGAKFEKVMFRPDWSLEDDFGAADERLKLAFLPNPNSPSGTVISPQRVLELAEQLPCPLLVDEAYVDFAEESCISLVRRCEKVMVSRSLSKSYALAGLRLGYLVAQPHLISEFVKVKDSYNCDALSIAVATAAINDQAWLEETCAKIISTRKRLTEKVRRMGFTAPNSQANFVWCMRDNYPLKPLYERLKSNQILVRYMNYSNWGEGLRISVGTDEQVDACLALLEQNLV